MEGKRVQLCSTKNAEKNHTRALRNHTPTAGSKQNYSFAKDLRLESLQKASSLYERTKIELRERKEGAGPDVGAPPGLPRQRFPALSRGTLTGSAGRGVRRMREPEKNRPP